MNALAWYDLLASTYDATALEDPFYRRPRREAIDKLELTEGGLVVDLFCGPGINFEPLSARLGGAGRIVGLDGSAGMLAKARAVAERLERGGRLAGIELLRVDFTTDAGLRAVEDAILRHRARSYLFTLGLTCLPNHQELVRAVYDAAPEGSVFSMLDIYSARRSLGAKYLNWIGAADCGRRVWQGLEDRASGFDLEEFRPFKVLGLPVLDASVVVARGRKPVRAAGIERGRPAGGGAPGAI